MFEEINDGLRRECLHLKNEVNPLRTILETTNFELPLYYALCNVTGNTPCEIAEGLTGLTDRKIRYPAQPPKAASRLTFDTVLYCADHTVSQEGGFFWNMELWWDSTFESLHETMEQMWKHVELVHDRYYPVVRGPSHLQAWNPMFGRWESIRTEEKDFWKSRFSLVCHEIGNFEDFQKLPSRMRNELLRKREWLKPLMDKKLSAEKVVTIGNEKPVDKAEFGRLYGRNVPEYYFFE